VSVPAVVLNNGVEMPHLGLGVWRVPTDETRRVVTIALEAGYRHIDTVVVTTRVWNSDQGYDATLRASIATPDLT
jgi:2,5-diketo-D-gluconate reductase A